MRECDGMLFNDLGDAVHGPSGVVVRRDMYRPATGTLIRMSSPLIAALSHVVCNNYRCQMWWLLNEMHTFFIKYLAWKYLHAYFSQKTHALNLSGLFSCLLEDEKKKKIAKKKKLNKKTMYSLRKCNQCFMNLYKWCSLI